MSKKKSKKKPDPPDLTVSDPVERCQGDFKEVDPEKDPRNWRYPWEKAWKEGLIIKW